MESNNQKLEELLKQMYAQEDLLNEDDEQLSQTIDEEWHKFEARHFPPRKQRTWGWMQIAASIVGVLMLSGIAYAAVQMVRSSADRDTQAQTEQATTGNTHLQVAQEAKQDTLQVAQEAKQDTLQMRPVVFEDKELSAILDEVAAYYQYEVVYQNKDARQIRLYFTWDRSQSIDTVIETFNRFERISIQKENRKLIVK